LKSLAMAGLPWHTITQVIPPDMPRLVIMTTAMVTVDIRPTTIIKTDMATTGGTMGTGGRTAAD
jgi:hypothetical protein